MAGTGSKVVLYVLNTIYLIIGLATAATSIWFFTQVYQLTSLRNTHHYMLDYNVYWPQVIPWIFFIVAIFVVGVSVCGFASAQKKSRGLISLYITALSIVVVCLIGTAAVALVFADSQRTDDFVKDTVWDSYFQAKIDTQVAESFGLIEKKLQCCGADSPRDYKNWRDEFPISCCDTYYHGLLDNYSIDCDFTNKLANERHGCSTVASQYARIVIKILSGASIFIAILGLLGVAAAVMLSRSLQKRTREPALSLNETESKKVLL